MQNLINSIPLPALAAAIVSLLVALLLVATKHRHGHLSLDSGLGVQKVHTDPTLRIGGVAIMAGVLVAYVLADPGR